MKEEQAQASCKELVYLFKEMDDDGSGSLTLAELREAYQKFDEFGSLLRVIDVSAEDLDTVFASMDTDGGGTVDYNEFVEELHRIRTMDEVVRRVLLVLLDQCQRETSIKFLPQQHRVFLIRIIVFQVQIR